MIFRLLLLWIIVSACTTANIKGDLARFLPAEAHLKNGVVSKFYVHGTRREGLPFTDIRYDRFSLAGDSRIRIETFNAGYLLISERVIQITGPDVTLLQEKHVRQGDTISAKVLQSGYLSLRKEKETAVETRVEPPVDQRTIANKKFEKDTIVLARDALIFSETFAYYPKVDSDSAERGHGNFIFVAGIGLYSSVREYDDVTYRLELVEQMPDSKFQLLVGKNLRRVAYIDPDSTLDKGTSFKLCNAEEKIYDYYNAGDNACHGAGKKEMVAHLNTVIDPSKLFEESGYLTFRFVVNCEGNAGRFLTEETDLDFRRKKFNAETVKHLYHITRDLQHWKPLDLAEPVDAYFYLTYKLSHGKIIDILP